MRKALLIFAALICTLTICTLTVAAQMGGDTRSGRSPGTDNRHFRGWENDHDRLQPSFGKGPAGLRRLSPLRQRVADRR